MAWWVPLAVAGAQMVGQLAMGKRSASDEIPGIAELMAQSTAGRRDAQMFARAAADPTSEWFRGLQGALEENFINQAFRAMREKDIRDMRKIGRGIPASMVTNPERRDEARYASWIDALQRARLQSTTLTPELLLRAASASSGAAQVPSGALQLFAGYGDREATRRSDLISGGGGILEGLLRQFAKGSGSTSGATPQAGWGGDYGDPGYY